MARLQIEILKLQEEKMKHKLQLIEKYEEKILRKFKQRPTFRTALLPQHYYNNNSHEKIHDKNILQKYKEDSTIFDSDAIYNMKTIDKFIGNKSVLDKETIKIIDVIAEFEKNEKSLKEIGENLKALQMNRLFKEFILNDYEKRFCTNKKLVISALIGEEQMQQELLRQAREEKVKLFGVTI